MKLYEQGEVGFNIGKFQVLFKDKCLYINGEENVFYHITIFKDSEFVSGTAWSKNDFTIKKMQDWLENFLEEQNEDN